MDYGTTGLRDNGTGGLSNPRPKNLFFITGLARSRTAWLANLFTWGGSVCYHDLLAAEPSAGGIVARLRETVAGGAWCAGDSDSGLLLCFEEILELVPDARWLLVNRPISDAHASFCRAFGGSYGHVALQAKDVWCAFQELSSRLERARQIIPAAQRMEVRFGGLDDVDCLEQIAWWLTPSQKFNRARAEELQRLRIEPHPAKVAIGPGWSARVAHMVRPTARSVAASCDQLVSEIDHAGWKGVVKPCR